MQCDRLKFKTACQDHQAGESVFLKKTIEWREWVLNRDHVDHKHGARTVL